MVKHTQAIRQLLSTNCLSLFDHFVTLALKGLTFSNFSDITLWNPIFLITGDFYVRTSCGEWMQQLRTTLKEKHLLFWAKPTYF